MPKMRPYLAEPQSRKTIPMPILQTVGLGKTSRKRGQKMKKLALFLAFAFIFGCSKNDSNPLTGTPIEYNPNGVWSYSGNSVSYTPGNCGLAGDPFASISGTFTVTKTGQDISALGSNGITYTGFWDDNAAAMTAIYTSALPGFVETDVVSFALSSDTNGTGALTWGLTNTGTGQSCSGSVRLTITR
jgi:hypothetical protein